MEKFLKILGIFVLAIAGAIGMLFFWAYGPRELVGSFFWLLSLFGKFFWWMLFLVIIGVPIIVIYINSRREAACQECGENAIETELIDEVYMGQEDTSFWLPREGGISNWKRVERTSPVTRKTFKSTCKACGDSYTYSEKSID